MFLGQPNHTTLPRNEKEQGKSVRAEQSLRVIPRSISKCNLKEDPEGVKWELGLAGFCPGKMGFKPLGLGFGYWECE